MNQEDQTSEPSSQATTRRQFLTCTLLTAAGLSLTRTAFADALGKADGANPIILGQGAHRYEWVPDWLTPPPSIKWGGHTGHRAGRAGAHLHRAHRSPG